MSTIGLGLECQGLLPSCTSTIGLYTDNFGAACILTTSDNLLLSLYLQLDAICRGCRLWRSAMHMDGENERGFTNREFFSRMLRASSFSSSAFRRFA